MNDTDELFQGVRQFAAVAKSSSFRRAAEELGVSTPAVSKAIRRLEERMGVQLFTRTSRNVALTPEGQRFLDGCQEAIASLEAAREQLLEARRAPSGELHVSMSLILGPQVIPALPRFTARYPRLALRVSLSDRVSRLHEERIDVALRVGVRKDSSLIQKRLFATRWVTVASPSFAARHAVPTEPLDLVSLNCLRFLLPTGKPRAFTFRAAGGETFEQSVRGNLVIDHGQHLLEAALGGMGVAQVLDFMVVEHLRGGDLIELLPDHSAPGPPVCAVSAPERRRSPNVRAFHAFLGDLFPAVG
jgi:LysR family transcriptional regulator, regulator for bpeEF and oprC